MGQNHVQRETIHTKKKGRIHVSFTCVYELMLFSIILYRPVPIPSLLLRGSPSLGLLETPQVSYSVIIPIHQHKHDKKRAGFPGQLIAGHVDQAKSNGSR